MFLKRIEMQGFKSFADKVNIEFNDNIIGIVGPNGCGKSNISDAIRWVLGEQSIKELRGKVSSDIIFNGSENRNKVNFACVTLVFDNSNHTFNIDYDEVALTRKISRISSENEYYINHTLCRLKDIIDLILDTGLGKDSLSIISQGNIVDFAMAKPIERRAIFEDAAGVSKYKKRKIETLSKLERTSENLDRLQDIINELDNQYQPLKRQAEKAIKYLDLKKQLEEIEVSVIVSDIHIINNKLANLNNSIMELDSIIVTNETTSNVFDNFCFNQKSIINNLDKEINTLQEKLFKVMQQIQNKETQKFEFEQKQKYALEKANKGNNLDLKIKEYQENLLDLQDRQKRFDDLSTKEKMLFDLKQDLTNDYENQLSVVKQKRELLSSYEKDKAVLENIISKPLAHQQGVAAVMDNKSLIDIMGVVINIVKPLDTFEQAIEAALGNSLYNIVTKNEEAARHAINYLKSNSCGKATFLPMSVLKERLIFKENLFIAQNTQGFIGVASDFVWSEDKFSLLINYLLGNTIICDTLKNANELSRRLKHSIKIVTLDGEIVHIGGSMSGGRNKNSNSLLQSDKQLTLVNEKIEDLNNTLLNLNDLLNKKQAKVIDNDNELVQLKIDLSSLQMVVNAKEAKVNQIKNELEMEKVDLNIINAQEFDSELLEEINHLYQQKDELTSTIRSRREQKMKLSGEVDGKQQQIRQLRQEYITYNNQLSQLKIDQAKQESKLDNLLQTLSANYEMTFEKAIPLAKEVDDLAKEQVNTLRYEINKLGSVNIDAPEEFAVVKERYEFLTKNKSELEDSKDQLLKIINDMDKVMSEQFITTFDKINEQLPLVFNELFGGGKASLSLDSEDILTAGIEINIQPKGKSVSNIRLFSGGEKSLIALCVLFAILQVKPVPLCILDEVEAALDTANVERFADYLQKLSDKSQFIVVTHRSGTMERCDSLYGITMNNTGVSMVLNVKLKDALDFTTGE
ncbi:MAG: AAA family ATPase [Erysipelotrichaceae bacterium]